MKRGYVAPNGACLFVEATVYKRDAPMALKSETNHCS
jgi:hypothetical protein